MSVKKLFIGFLAMTGAVFILIIFATTYVFTTDPLNLWSNTTS